ncbi:MAG TPA: DUF503 domain-containing protein [Tissierellia bacterium]|nr:DUF503 domain-containing protein [Tissierellia bacterium]
MYSLTVKLTLFLPLSQSLKDKRRVRRAVIDRYQKKVLIKEVATQESWQSLTLGFALVSLRESDLYQQLDDLLYDITESGEVELQSRDFELVKL